MHSHAENVHGSHAGTSHIIIKFKTHRALNRGKFAKYVNVYTNTTDKEQKEIQEKGTNYIFQNGSPSNQLMTI